MKDVENGLRFGQVDPSVKKSSLGEFARAGGPSAEGVDRVQNCFDDEGITVAGNFHKIFPCVRFWVGPSGDDDFVQGLCVQAQAGGKGIFWGQDRAR